MSNLLINEPPLMVLPSLACEIGLNESIILQQVHYWLNPRINKNFKEGHHWVYNSYDQWKEQFPFWSIRTLRRTFLSLEEMGLLVSDNLNNRGFDKKKWYRIDYIKLENLSKHQQNSIGPKWPHRLGQNGPIERDKVAPSNGPMWTDAKAKMAPSYIEAETTTDTLSPYDPKLAEMKNKKGGGDKDLSDPKAIEMIEIWDSVLKKREGVTFKNLKRINNLSSVLKTYFEGSLLRWEQYCLQIKSSKFLMGETKEKFQAKIDWAIKPESIEKILEGSISSGDREEEAPSSKEGLYTLGRERYSLLTPQEIARHKEAYTMLMKKRNPAFSEESLEDPSWQKSFKHYVVNEIIKATSA